MMASLPTKAKTTVNVQA